MSAEYYYAGHEENDIRRACHNAEVYLYEGIDPIDKLNSIAKELHETSLGEAELLRMKRVATFICDQNNPSTPPNGVASFMYGELAAEHLLRHITGKKNLAGSYAHEHLKQRMDEARDPERVSVTKKEYKEYLVNAFSTPLPSPLDSTKSHIETATHLRIELSGGELELPEPYESYFENTANQIPLKRISFHHFMMGFRIVMHEFHKPSQADDYDFLVQSIGQDVPSRGESIVKGISLDELRAMLPENEGVRYESIAPPLHQLFATFTKLQAAFKEFKADASDPTALIAIRKMQEKQLQAMNRDYELLNKQDIIFARGDQAVYVHRGGGSEWHAFSKDVEFSGMFDSIVITDAPTEQRIHEALALPIGEQQRSLLKHTMPSIAVRLSEPTIMVNGEAIHQDDATVDIPIIYPGIVMQRLADSQFKAEFEE